jgi:hypothetical protein
MKYRVVDVIDIELDLDDRSDWVCDDPHAEALRRATAAYERNVHNELADLGHVSQVGLNLGGIREIALQCPGCLLLFTLVNNDA